MARPIHQLLIAEAPVWLLEEIIKWARDLFWAGKQGVSGGQCLVPWDSACRPWSQGGLGIKNLQLQGLALRSRWEWLRRTDPERPWQGLPMLRDQSTRAVFDTLAVITIGDGKQVMFWIDRWINGLTATDIAPMVVVSVSTRKKNRRRVADALAQDAWVGDVSANISIEGWLQCINLWEAIDSIRLDASRPDIFRWTGSPSGEYSAKSTYKMLCQGRTTVAFYKLIWRSFAPLKCKIFCWLAFKHRLWTSDRRVRRGLHENPDACFTCLQGEDNVEHILAQCPYSRSVWVGCLHATGLHLREPEEGDTLERWWSVSRARVCNTNRRKFDTLVILVARSLWKQRNARVFANVS
jgi:hypothetical protein